MGAQGTVLTVLQFWQKRSNNLVGADIMSRETWVTRGKTHGLQFSDVTIDQFIVSRIHNSNLIIAVDNHKSILIAGTDL